MIDRRTFPAVLFVLTAFILVVTSAVPGCHRCVTPTHEHGDPKVGYGPKNPCPCDGPRR